MQTWVVDAAGFRIEDVKEFELRLLERTPAVRTFLESSNREIIAVAAPKGFGKTLLLMLKRLEFVGQGIRLLPSDSALIDKMATSAPTLSASQVQFIQTRSDFWHFSWFSAFAIGAIKAAEELPSEAVHPKAFRSATLQEILEDPLLKNPSDIFKRLLLSSAREYQSIISDHDKFTKLLREIKSPIYMFLDNVDEFCDKYLPLPETPHSSTGEYDRRFWYDAQTGAIKAARSISQTCQHVRAYCAIRKEALDLLSREDPQSNQIQGACIPLTYSKADLKSILQRNIQNSDEFSAAPANDTFARWVGPDGSTLTHGTTGERETLPEYIIRHTLSRPRDVATLGRSIALLPMIERTPKNLKDVINQAASSIVRSYIAECRPHVPCIDPNSLFPLISKNVLSIDELERIGEAYVLIMRRSGYSEDLNWRKVFSILFRMGLLGFVGKRAGGDGDTQIFLPPGTQNLIGPDFLPEATEYLLHPALSDYIAADYQPKYLRNANRMNIIGDGRPWRHDNQGFFVIVGDIVHSSQIIGTEGEAAFFDQFKKWVDIEGRGLLFREVYEGDKLVLADQNAAKVLNRAQEIARRLKCSEYGKSIRFGGNYGVLSFEDAQSRKRPHGTAFKRAARIQVVGAPDAVTVSDDFFHRAAKEQHVSAFAYLGDMNISKIDEPPESPKLWRVNLKFE